MKGKGMITLLFQPPQWQGTKIRIASIGEENQERREEEKLKEEAESSYGLCPQGCEDIRSATLSPTSYCSIKLCEIAPLSNSCAPNLVEAATDSCVSWCLRSSSAL
jgi:hypothetical protein